MSIIPHEQLLEIIKYLDKAFYDHQQWHNMLIRDLVCKLPINPTHLKVNAYKLCQFGQWYYGPKTNILRTNATFIQLGKTHLKMHQATRRLLLISQSNSKIPTEDYDLFSMALDDMRHELDQLQRELADLLYHRDPLTGTINRINLLPYLREQQEWIKRHQACCCSLAILDFDHFKSINDTYGHVAGDSVLTQASQFIMNHLRIYDRFFRYGGEEFIIFMQNINVNLAYVIIERIREGIASLPIDIGNQTIIHVTASFGITAVDTEHTIEEQLKRADKALYQAKKSGRNNTKIA